MCACARTSVYCTCAQGEGGGELYNRTSAIEWSADTREMENASTYDDPLSPP